MAIEERKDDGENEEDTNGKENEQQETKNKEHEDGVGAIGNENKNIQEEEEDAKPKAKVMKNNSGRDNAVASTLPFPKSFYDPISERLMLDPVVHPNGISYEKKDVMERQPSTTTYYTNRALKAYIDREVDRIESAGSMRGKLLEITDSIRTNFQKLLETSAIPSSEFKPLPGTQQNKSFFFFEIPLILLLQW